MSRVLLTGATGFVGRPTLQALLRRGHEVDAVARTAGAEQPGVTWHEADLLAPGATSKLCETVAATHLVHLAWYAEPGRFWEAPENDAWSQTSIDLLREFARAGGRVAVLSGSCAEYGWGDEPLDELASPLEPATRYGKCKLATYRRALELGEELGLRLAWARFFFLYGPGESPGRLVSDVVLKLLRGERVATTAGTQRRDFLHVGDAAEALAAILDSSLSGPVNVCSGEAPSIRSVVEEISSAIAAGDRVDFGALPMRPGDPAVIVGENRRLREQVGYSPGIGLTDGIRETIAWWQRGLAEAGGRASG